MRIVINLLEELLSFDFSKNITYSRLLKFQVLGKNHSLVFLRFWLYMRSMNPDFVVVFVFYFDG